MASGEPGIDQPSRGHHRLGGPEIGSLEWALPGSMGVAPIAGDEL
jgi:hypothetical protein